MDYCTLHLVDYLYHKSEFFVYILLPMKCESMPLVARPPCDGLIWVQTPLKMGSTRFDAANSSRKRAQILVSSLPATTAGRQLAATNLKDKMLETMGAFTHSSSRQVLSNRTILCVLITTYSDERPPAYPENKLRAHFWGIKLSSTVRTPINHASLTRNETEGYSVPWHTPLQNASRHPCVLCF